MTDASVKTIETQVLLTSQSKWTPWINQIRFRALDARIWQYIDPNSTAVAEPTKPPKPSLSNINPTAMSFQNLTPAEFDMYKFMMNEYTRDKAEFNQTMSSISAIRTLIFKILPVDSYIYIEDLTTVRSMLDSLRQQFKPTDRTRQLKVTKRYQKLQKEPKNGTAYQWLQDWMRVYKEASELGLPEVYKDRPLFAFLTAIESLDSTWASNKKQMLNYTLMETGEIPSMQKIVEEFKNFRRIEDMILKTHTATRSAFTTFQGKQPDGNNKNKEEKERLPPMCVCKERHMFSDCQYLIKDLKNEKWDATKQKMVDNKVKSLEQEGSRLFEFIKWARRQYKPKKNNSVDDNQPESGREIVALFSSHVSYTTELATSVLLDGGSNINICNDPSRFAINKLVNEKIRSGTTEARVTVHGSYLVHSMRADGSEQRLKIRNAKLVPDYITSVVSESYLNDIDVHKDSTTLELRKRGNIICMVKRSAGLFFLEDNRGQLPDVTRQKELELVKPKPIQLIAMPDSEPLPPTHVDMVHEYKPLMTTVDTGVTPDEQLHQQLDLTLLPPPDVRENSLDEQPEQLDSPSPPDINARRDPLTLLPPSGNDVRDTLNEQPRQQLDLILPPPPSERGNTQSPPPYERGLTLPSPPPDERRNPQPRSSVRLRSNPPARIPASTALNDTTSLHEHVTARLLEKDYRN